MIHSKSSHKKNKAGINVIRLREKEDRLLSKVIPLDTPEFEKNGDNGVVRRRNGDEKRIS